MLATEYERQNKTAARWLLEYDERKQQYEQAVAEFAALGATVSDGMPHGSSVGNPTASKAVKLAELNEQKAWLEAVESAQQVFGDKKQVFVELRRRAEKIDHGEVGRPGWCDYVQMRYADWHERQYGKSYLPSRQVMYDWWGQIVDVTVRIALSNGCLRAA